MSKFNHIQQIISELPVLFKVEEVDLDNAFNRILQEDVLADINMPPFNKSAMDGYACKIEDIGTPLEVLEVINAGKMSTKQVGKNQCVKIMTGAAVPDSCDCVFKVEDSEDLGNNLVRCINDKTAKNICYLGEDYKRGDKLLSKGTILKEAQMAVLASAGYAKVKVSTKPVITLIATGSELVLPSEKPKPGQIRNSNAIQVISQLKKMNLDVVTNLMIADDYEKLKATFIEAQQTSNFIIFTGGASVGDFDFIPEILSELNFEVYWARTGIKPGNPMSFSRKGNVYCFGLSGNPVSSLMQFELIAKPTIYKLLGADFKPTRLKGEMAFNFRRRKADRVAIIPVLINEDGLVGEIPFHGSAHINALAFANALLEVPTDIKEPNKGDSAYVRPL